MWVGGENPDSRFAVKVLGGPRARRSISKYCLLVSYNHFRLSSFSAILGSGVTR